MKFLHTADLHIGKSLYEFSLRKEQEYLLKQIVKVAKEERVDAVLLAGDIYDRSIPSSEAVLILDDFLTELMQENIQILMIAGNHDSPERLHFANRILEKQGLTIAGMVEEAGVKQVILRDEYGEVEVTLLPFVKPAAFGGKNSQEAVELLLGQLPNPKKKTTRRVCMTHFFVTQNGASPELSESETSVYVGGLDNVESKVFDGFDYVALGHIHKAQQIGNNHIYYAGSPMKYSFSEAGSMKSVTLVTLKEKGAVSVERKEIPPLHDVIRIKGTLDQLIQCRQAGERCEDYVQATLLDEDELLDPIGTLRSVYPNICQLLIQKYERKEQGTVKATEHALQKQKSLVELFHDFYETVIGHEMDQARNKVITEIMKEVQE